LIPHASHHRSANKRLKKCTEPEVILWYLGRWRRRHVDLDLLLVDSWVITFVLLQGMFGCRFDLLSKMRGKTPGVAGYVYLLSVELFYRYVDCAWVRLAYALVRSGRRISGLETVSGKIKRTSVKWL
jgi:hypothetical protein